MPVRTVLLYIRWRCGIVIKCSSNSSGPQNWLRYICVRPDCPSLLPQSVCRPIRLSSPCGLLFYAIIAGVWLPFGINLYAVAVADGNYHFIIAGEAGRATTATATAAAAACITSSSHTSFYSSSSSTYVSTCGSASTSASVPASVTADDSHHGDLIEFTLKLVMDICSSTNYSHPHTHTHTKQQQRWLLSADK